MSFIKSAALLAALALTAAPAALAERPTREVTISYGDLNLQNQAGIDTLFVRIGNAARKVCGDRPQGVIEVHVRYRACRETVTGQTVRSINIPNVTVAWAEMSREPIQTAMR